MGNLDLGRKNKTFPTEIPQMVHKSGVSMYFFFPSALNHLCSEKTFKFLSRPPPQVKVDMKATCFLQSFMYLNVFYKSNMAALLGVRYCIFPLLIHSSTFVLLKHATPKEAH